MKCESRFIFFLSMQRLSKVHDLQPPAPTSGFPRITRAGPLASPQAAWIVDDTIESPREIFDPRRASKRAKRCSADNLTFVHTMVLMDEEPQ